MELCKGNAVTSVLEVGLYVGDNRASGQANAVFQPVLQLSLLNSESASYFADLSELTAIVFRVFTAL